MNDALAEHLPFVYKDGMSTGLQKEVRRSVNASIDRTCPPPLRVHPDILRDDRNVRYATEADLNFLVALRGKLNWAVGYTPRGAFQDRIERRRIIVIDERGEPAGYINHTHRKDGLTHISQVAVHPDLWRTACGTHVMQTIINAAQDAGSDALTLRSALDLPANYFWPTMGFLPQGTVQGQVRPLIAWARPLKDRLVFPILSPPRGGRTLVEMHVPYDPNAHRTFKHHRARPPTTHQQA